MQKGWQIDLRIMKGKELMWQGVKHHYAPMGSRVDNQVYDYLEFIVIVFVLLENTIVDASWSCSHVQLHHKTIMLTDSFLCF